MAIVFVVRDVNLKRGGLFVSITRRAVLGRFEAVRRKPKE